MTDTQSNLQAFLEKLKGNSVQLVAVSKTKPEAQLMEAYEVGWRDFGENKVQEMTAKYEALPQDIRWHLIGTLQTNKIKYIAPYVYLIHSVDRLKVLKEIDKRAEQNERIINCLLQIHIADEETKSGFDYAEAEQLLKSEELLQYQHVKIIGLMGMATNTDNMEQVRREFRGLKQFYDRMQAEIQQPNVAFSELSMGMSGDYEIAIEEGSTMIRVGSAIFGARNYD